jgi:peptidoglycan hydrolase-like protein with peptidoglycan-binding domain
MFFPLLVFVVALSIAAIAAWFSVVGLMAIFAASAIPVAIMAGSLEIGKLVTASWVYRNWKRAPFLLKSYLTFATIVLMFITSLGIFGFLSSAYLEQAAEGQQSTAKIERIANDIIRTEDTIARAEVKIEKLENETSEDTSDIQSQIDAEQERMDKAFERVQPAIDEQLSIIDNEQRGAEDQVKSYLEQLEAVDNTISLLQSYVANDEIKKLQALVGARADGNYGSRTAAKVEEFRSEQQAEKERLVAIIEDIRTSVDGTVVEQAREEIKRLRDQANQNVQKSQETIDRLRSQLNAIAEVDNTAEIDSLIEKVRDSENYIEELLDEKFELESEVRKLEAEVGPIKYIADMVYGNQERGTIDEAVRWLIIVFIFVFDPLAVLLLIAANFSFLNRNDHDGRQEEIFDALFAKKKEEKTLDKSEEIVHNDEHKETEEHKVVVNNSDEAQVHAGKKEYILRENASKEVSIEDIIRNASPEALEIVEKELEREINTRKEKRNGWLDDLDK